MGLTPSAPPREQYTVGVSFGYALIPHAISPLRSCLRRLRTTLIRDLSNMGGKLWIPREHVVEGVLVERVEVAVVYSADAGSAGLAEEEGEFPEELAIRECRQHRCAVRHNDFYRAATDEVHVVAVL